MSERIYYTDPGCQAFTARVTRSFLHGDRAAVTLDRTAFYPTSGGQPFDTGVLGDVPVVEVLDEAGEVVHLLDHPLAEGREVEGRVDWTRRFDHMQQHTGQHILSAVFERLSGHRTVSFHMGSELSTIDLSRDVNADEVARAEDEANRAIWDDLPVGIRFASPDEAAAMPLRKESVRTGTLRLIGVPGIDLSACGGTHVASTGAIGAIVVTGWERVKGGARVSFACGGRAVRAHRRLAAVVTGSVRVLSVLPPELPAAIERLQAEAKEQRKAVKALQERLAVFEAEALLASASTVNGVRVIARVLDGYDAAGLKTMASAVTTVPDAAVAFLSSGTPLQIVIARSAGLAGIDAGSLLRRLVEQFGGRGGGKADLAQGGGFEGDVRQILWTVSGLLEDAAGGTR